MNAMMTLILIFNKRLFSENDATNWVVGFVCLLCFFIVLYFRSGNGDVQIEHANEKTMSERIHILLFYLFINEFGAACYCISSKTQ